MYRNYTYQKKIVVASPLSRQKKWLQRRLAREANKLIVTVTPQMKVYAGGCDTLAVCGLPCQRRPLYIMVAVPLIFCLLVCLFEGVAILQGS